jgi:hypothetical protein
MLKKTIAFFGNLSRLAIPSQCCGSMRMKLTAFALLAVSVFIFDFGCSSNVRSSSSRPQESALPSGASSASPLPKVLVPFPKIVFKKRREVEAIIGKPKSYQRHHDEGDFVDAAVYSWGEAWYNRGFLTGLQLEFPKQATDTTEAFALVGLPSPSTAYYREPDNTSIWTAHPFGTTFRCCDGLVFEDIFTNDLKVITIVVINPDMPSAGGMTREEVNMWVAHTGTPPPKPPGWYLMEMPIIHDSPSRHSHPARVAG